MREKYVIGLIFVISGVLLGTYIAKTSTSHTIVESTISENLWPAVVLLLLFITSGIQLGKLLLRKKAVEEQLSRESEEKRKKEEEETGEREVLPLFLFGMVISFLYIFIIKWIGFTVATPIFMAIFLYVVGYRKKLMLAIVSLATVAVYLLLFVKATYIPLPRGFGIFRAVSLLFY